MLLPMSKETTLPARASAIAAQGLVCVVDDDESVRESLPDLLRELGYSAQAFASAEEFLASAAAAVPWCLILDVAMPGMTGPELQRELLAAAIPPNTDENDLEHVGPVGEIVRAGGFELIGIGSTRVGVEVDGPFPLAAKVAWDVRGR